MCLTVQTHCIIINQINMNLHKKQTQFGYIQQQLIYLEPSFICSYPNYCMHIIFGPFIICNWHFPPPHRSLQTWTWTSTRWRQTHTERIHWTEQHQSKQIWGYHSFNFRIRIVFITIEKKKNNTMRRFDFKVQLLFIQINTKLINFSQSCKHLVELQITLKKKLSKPFRR